MSHHHCQTPTGRASWERAAKNIITQLLLLPTHCCTLYEPPVVHHNQCCSTSLRDELTVSLALLSFLAFPWHNTVQHHSFSLNTMWQIEEAQQKLLCWAGSKQAACAADKRWNLQVWGRGRQTSLTKASIFWASPPKHNHFYFKFYIFQCDLTQNKETHRLPFTTTLTINIISH